MANLGYKLSDQTPNYLRVSFPGGKGLENSILPVQAGALTNDGAQLLGSIQQ